MKAEHVKPRAKPVAQRRAALIIEPRGLRNRAEVTVRFGSVEVRDASVSEAEKRRNVKTGQQALARAVPKIIKAGFARSADEKAPRYRADPHNPQVLIRELNGRSTKGIFVDGKFKVLTK